MDLVCFMMCPVYFECIGLFEVLDVMLSCFNVLWPCGITTPWHVRRSSDRWSDHAIFCCCGGDRVLRHNAIRDVVCSAVAELRSRSQAFSSPRGRPIQEAPPWMLISPSFPPLRLLPFADPLMSGFPG